MNFAIWSLLIVLLCPQLVWGKIRRVEAKPDQVATIRTATGIATIIQVPDRPNSVVVGDQSAFKVEYLDQAITIKPLHAGARSNLYIYTDYRRFNVQLVTVSQESADYVVYLESEIMGPSKSSLSWMKFKNHLRNNGITLEVRRLGHTKDGVLLIEFDIRSKTHEKFKAEWIWLTQSGVTRPIHRLALSSQEVGPNLPIQGVIQVLKNDIARSKPIRVELRRERISYLTVPKVTLWK